MTVYCCSIFILSIPDSASPGHIRDFIRACKGGDPTCSNFDVASSFVEWMLLGVIALRHEGKLPMERR